ncbi:MAG: acyl-CoA dehydrogenase family protein [Rhizomicrobium sp.]
MQSLILPHLLARCDEAVLGCEGLLVAAKDRVGAQLAGGGARHQRATHGLAWLATTIEALRQMARWAHALEGENRLGECEKLILQAAFGEYLSQILGGIPMNQNEIVRPGDLMLDDEVMKEFRSQAVKELIALGTHADTRAALAKILATQRGAITLGNPGLDDTMGLVREQFFRFAQNEIIPQAHGWHLKDQLIPLDVVSQLSALGVFGLTIPSGFGGAGLSKTAMCVVSEELSRGFLGVGSLATRSEIAAELILSGGTKDQRDHWLPLIVSGEKLPAAVFTEPEAGSDLGSLRTRAVRDGNVYRITGNKTWITHAARADVMTLLARTGPNTTDHHGLSMFLAEKPRGTDGNPFPAKGMSGSEIAVLGYRGMREYEIAFDGFEIPAENLLGLVEGHGFKQLMHTFEAARIQTAARAIGVAASALDLGLGFALERRQAGRTIFEYPRVADKLVMMAVEIAAARQLTYYAAREKDAGRRCDQEAGMAKLLAARVAWAAADGALQIHGGNGFALEYPVSRVLWDARILNIFEGAGEIQAHVIARRLLEERGN